MKNFLFVLISLALLVSCKKDDAGPANNIKYNDLTYEINKGYLENYGLITEGVYSFDLWLASNDIIITEDNLSGVGNLVYIGFLSNSPKDLTSGTYTFTNTQSSPFTFYFSFIGLDFDIANQIGTSLTLVGGTVEVVSDGTNYEFTLNGVLVNGKSLTAYYKGPITVFDFTGSE